MAIPQFWLVHVGAAAVGLVAFVLFKLFLSHRFDDSGREQAVPASRRPPAAQRSETTLSLARGSGRPV